MRSKLAVVIGIATGWLLLIAVFAFAVPIQSTTSSPAQVSQQPTTTQSITYYPGIAPQVMFGLRPGPSNSSTTSLPANTLLWESFTMSNYTHVDDIDTEMQVPSSSYGSVLHLAVFVNGALEYQGSFNVVRPVTANDTVISSNVESFPLEIDAGFTKGSVITIGVLCNATLDTYAFGTGHSYETQTVSIPSVGPSVASAAAESFQFSAWGESFT